MSFADGSFAVALVKNRVMVVQATRTHTKREKYLDVTTYAPFGEGVFLATDVPCARIASSDLLTVLPENTRRLSQGMLELPQKDYSQYVAASSRHQKRYESLWNALVSRN
ncbi:hypothetical protein BDN70DRAFT_91549 [Pholiota conissans]|uniref:Uncharacterized protein n=1 Tax=Pholiota conissans TaxID=109636 RepID=A0A9P5YYC8_9AGAR|nr:hypothetical protein BDN70DRAFT_91549 [Pholiota conissans]